MDHLPQSETPATPSRRQFLKTSAAVAGSVLAADLVIPQVHAAGSDLIGVGLIGCGSPRGGRGRGAAQNCVNAGPNVKLVAMGDLFPDHLAFTRNALKSLGPDKVDVPEDRCFVGFDAYEKVLACKEVQVVILTTPPHFRPLHLQAAVAAGKHIFCEKPVAVDAAGVRSVLKSSEEARKKNLSLVSGLCWRYDKGMRETFQRLHDGAVGQYVALQCTYNTGGLWVIPRQPGWSDVEWQIRNWLYFTWLSGDHICEQHIHSLDKMAWAMRDEYPLRAVGSGGRQVRTAAEYGNIFDHHNVVFEYANGLKVFSSCRQQDGCAKDVTDHVMGTEGTCDVMKFTIRGRHPWKYKPDSQDPGMYQNEHNELIASIRAGKPINNGDYMAKSTLMAIMGRMATYTGQVITWEQALNSKEDLGPRPVEFGPYAVAPVALPGITKFF
ncbi:MAG: Gfo/Idh/MocA family oxidoreductase [Planctomycetes bacterium]|nr:Gfo/Idh/MocA family oxidoreductase [Planctomycetota bacterium]